MKLKRALALLIILGILLSIVPLYATPDEATLKAQQKKNQTATKKTQTALAQKNKQLKQVSNQVEKLDKDLYSTAITIERIEKELEKLDVKVSVTKRELERAMESEKGQKELLKKRIRAMYENGNVGYLSVILDSTSFSDFLTRLDFLKKIIDFDVNLLNDMNLLTTNIEETNEQLKKEQNEKETLKSELGEKKQKLEDLMKDKKSEISNLTDDIEELEKQYDQHLKEAEVIAKKMLELMNSKKYTGGTMDWPAPDYYKITSEYGYRTHPILKKKKMHTGIDISVPTGKNIVAANSGTVIYSDYYGGYGYTVIIDHGGKISTLYAHNSKLLVKEGDEVKKGDIVAKSGSTGLSTGPHLHFEVREDGQHVDPMKYYK